MSRRPPLDVTITSVCSHAAARFTPLPAASRPKNADSGAKPLLLSAYGREAEAHYDGFSFRPPYSRVRHEPYTFTAVERGLHHAGTMTRDTILFSPSLPIASCRDFAADYYLMLCAAGDIESPPRCQNIYFNAYGRRFVYHAVAHLAGAHAYGETYTMMLHALHDEAELPEMPFLLSSPR